MALVRIMLSTLQAQREGKVTPSPILLKIGPIVIYWYGFLIMTGVVLAATVAARLAKNDGQDPEHVWSALVWCLVFGIVGARLYHVIHKWKEIYSQNPGLIFGLHMAGFGIYGAVLGGMLGMYIYTRRHKLSFIQWADYAFVGVPLAQALGRWGNFFNQELFGFPTNLPWGIYIQHDKRDFEYPQYVNYDGRFHPLFLYESLWDLASFALLWFLAHRFKKRLLRGDLACIYGLLYPFGRFFIEFLRAEPDLWRIGGIPTAQIIAVIVFVFCGSVLIYRHLIAKQQPVPETVPVEALADASATEEREGD